MMYFGSNTKERGFVMGLSCLYGTKKKLFLFNSFPIFSAEPANPSFVETAITKGFPFLRCDLIAIVADVSVIPTATFAIVFP